jgi:hypothetical protein
MREVIGMGEKALTDKVYPRVIMINARISINAK